MLDNDENSGILTFLIGMIVVVMAGVGLSILIDKRFKFSSGASEFQKEFSGGASDLATLRILYFKKVDKFETAYKSSQSSNSNLRELRVDRSRLATIEHALSFRRNEIQSAVAQIQKEFSDYRADYRTKQRVQATGERLGNLKVRGGREFQGAVIRQVTDVGLEIRHEHGIARIQAPDLPSSFQDRFQWSAELRRQKLLEEDQHFHGSTPSSAQDTRLISLDRTTDKSDPSEGDEALKKRRSKIMVCNRQIARITRLLREGASDARRDQKSSAPSTLELWRKRKIRLNAELEIARLELKEARAQLQELSPNDSLLKPDPQ